MAEAVLEILLDNLNSHVQKKLGLFLGFEKDFKSLSSLITTIKATLQDAEEKQFTDKAIKDWLLKLKDAAHVLDDILEECATKALELEYKKSKGGLTDKVQSSCLSSLHPKQVAFRYKIAKKMQSIRERLDEIADEKTKFHLTETVREEKSGFLDWLQTTPIISQPQVYGRGKDEKQIANFLVHYGVKLGVNYLYKKFHLTETVREEKSGFLDCLQTTSIISQPQVDGRGKDEKQTVDFLVDSVVKLGVNYLYK